eukprot:jgi/Bigna1/134188/aug1.24_g8896
MVEKIIVETTERPTASDLLLHVEQWCKEDVRPAASEPVQQTEQDSKENDSKLKEYGIPVQTGQSGKASARDNPYSEWEDHF